MNRNRAGSGRCWSRRRRLRSRRRCRCGIRARRESELSPVLPVERSAGCVRRPANVGVSAIRANIIGRVGRRRRPQSTKRIPAADQVENFRADRVNLDANIFQPSVIALNQREIRYRLIERRFDIRKLRIERRRIDRRPA